MKVCCICNIEKDYCAFGNNKSAKDGLSAQCKECAKAYRDANKGVKYPSSTKEYREIYIKKNIEHINELRKIRYHKNGDEIRKLSRINYAENREEIRAYRSEYYFNNKEMFGEYNKEYRHNNKDAIYLRNRKRQKGIIAENIKQQEINDLLLNSNYSCFYCGCKISRGINLHLDHKVPLARGGEHSINNIAASCKSCNLRKGTKTIDEFMEYLQVCENRKSK